MKGKRVMAKIKDTVLQYAFKRLCDPDNSDAEYSYWSAYMDGARAQLQETHESGTHINDDIIKDIIPSLE